jgi:hypothetical protein
MLEKANDLTKQEQVNPANNIKQDFNPCFSR